MSVNTCPIIGTMRLENEILLLVTTSAALWASAIRIMRSGKEGSAFIPFKRFRFGQWALNKFKCLLFADYLVLLHILNLVSHKFPSKAFAYFSAWHLKNPLRRDAWNPLPGETNLPRRSIRNSGGDSRSKGRGTVKAALPSLCLFQSLSYIKYPYFHEKFQAVHYLFIGNKTSNFSEKILLQNTAIYNNLQLLMKKSIINIF